MYGIKLTLLIATIISAIVFAGNIWFSKKNEEPIDWKRTILSTMGAFGITILIGIITE